MKSCVVLIFGIVIANVLSAQNIKSGNVPAAVTAAFSAKYPAATKVHWEKEKGNYEANWGGKSGEDHSVIFTPDASFVEIVDAINVKELPSPVHEYVATHYKGIAIKEAGRVTDAAGRMMFEAEIKGHDLIFDEKGLFLKED